MYTMDDLLHLVHSDGATGLKVRVGHPPQIVLDGEGHQVEGPVITPENAEQLFQSISDTRQRRDLREQRVVVFIYTFRERASFVVRAQIEGENICLDIQ